MQYNFKLDGLHFCYWEHNLMVTIKNTNLIMFAHIDSTWKPPTEQLHFLILLKYYFLF